MAEIKKEKTDTRSEKIVQCVICGRTGERRLYSSGWCPHCGTQSVKTVSFKPISGKPQIVSNRFYENLSLDI